MGVTMNVYDKLKPMENDLRLIYKHGGRVACEIFRDLEIYEAFQKSNAPKMERYTNISEHFKVSESLVRAIIKQMGKKIL
jgi:hypothetical protein